MKLFVMVCLGASLLSCSHAQITDTSQSSQTSNINKLPSERTIAQTNGEVLLSETENASNPIPSPDGSMIAYVRTGRWEKGSGGLGRSNLRSEVMVMTSDGRTLTEKPIADAFLSGWSPDGKHLICYRSYQAFLVSIEGLKSRQVQIPQSGFITPERVAYLPALDALAWIQNGFSDQAKPGPHNHSASIRTANREIAKNNFHVGDMLVPSPDGRYIAAIDVTNWCEKNLWVYDTQTDSWANLGKANVHPDIINPNNDWDWMGSSWDPWFRDSSRLAFVSNQSIVVSSPDGKSRQEINRVKGPTGLATPSTDAHFIAYVTFDTTLNKAQPHWTFWGNTTIWVVPTVPGSTPRAVTKKSSETTYCLRWLDSGTIVFDRFGEGSAYMAQHRLWKVEVSR
jgi:Tol biopolymer transport system component